MTSSYDFYFAEKIPARYPDLEGKTAIVTGTSRGIGCGIAAFLARQGMHLVLCSRSGGDTRDSFVGELTARGAEAVWVKADISEREGAERVYQKALEVFGVIDLLVNNASAVEPENFMDTSEDMYHCAFEKNTRMAFLISQQCARHMIERGEGSVIHISSVSGLRAHRGMACYDMSKGAIDVMTRAMAMELAPHGIRVNAVAPGAIFHVPVTPEMEKWYRKKIAMLSRLSREPFNTYEELVASQKKNVPLGRKGTVEEIGSVVAFLASNAAGYITGQTLYVDAGLTTQLTPPGIFV